MVDADFADFTMDGLNAHNDHRRKHGVPELRLSKELCDFAQEYANLSAKRGSISIRDEPDYGENIYSEKSKHPITIRDAVNVWYSTIKKHRFGTEQVKKKSYSFCQVVWKYTTELGLGMATNPKGKVFIVANYYPKGLRPGEFVENVPPVMENPDQE